MPVTDKVIRMLINISPEKLNNNVMYSTKTNIYYKKGVIFNSAKLTAKQRKYSMK